MSVGRKTKERKQRGQNEWNLKKIKRERSKKKKTERNKQLQEINKFKEETNYFEEEIKIQVKTETKDK